MNIATDTENPFEFVAQSLLLGLGGWVVGRSVERTVGKRGMGVRVAINAVVLYCIFMLLPWSIVSNFQNTLPGVIACATYFNSQSWNASALV
jgi:hypothetical protein